MKSGALLDEDVRTICVASMRLCACGGCEWYCGRCDGISIGVVCVCGAMPWGGCDPPYCGGIEPCCGGCEP